MPFSINLPLTMSIERIRKHIIENAQKEAEQIIKTAEEQFSAQVDVAKVSIEKQYHEMLQKEEERFKENMKMALSTLKTDYKIYDNLTFTFRAGYFSPGTAAKYLILGSDTGHLSPWELKSEITFVF